MLTNIKSQLKSKARRQLHSLKKYIKSIEFIKTDKGTDLESLIGPRGIYDPRHNDSCSDMDADSLRTSRNHGSDLDKGGKKKNLKKILLKWFQHTTALGLCQGRGMPSKTSVTRLNPVSRLLL